MTVSKQVLIILLGCLASVCFAGGPTVWIIGDSTVNNGSKGQEGWGEQMPLFFDASKVLVENRARGGRSSRSYFDEGLWDEVAGQIKPGDFVLIQFGHNDGGGNYFDEKRRASIHGTGDASETGNGPGGEDLVVHSYGWYLRRYASDTIQRGATPILISPIPRNRWKEDGTVEREDLKYGLWAGQTAERMEVPFLDLNAIVADYYDAMGPEKVQQFFPDDWTHTNTEGAEFNAACVAKGLRTLNIDLANCLVPPVPVNQRKMERLDRGVVGILQQDGHVFISWRLLGSDPEDVAFNLYRSNGPGSKEKLNAEPLSGPTFFVDTTPSRSRVNAYAVRALVDGVEQPWSKPFKLPARSEAKPYLSIKLNTPKGYAPNDASVGDLDGDGEYEIVLHQTGRGHDNSHGGETDPPILQAYKLDGTLLWEINLGKNIREGAHYTQFMVYDFDGDGKAEVACKTADGSLDSRRRAIGDRNADWVNKDGRILAGPEYLTVFNGETGEQLASADYLPPRHPETQNPTSAQLKDIWGDGYGNRGDRFLAAVAYLDGRRPSLIMCRGYYTRTVISAWDLRDGALEPVWTFDSAAGPESNRRFGGQGNHGLAVADVDGDGRDEIIYGGMCIDDNGQGLYSTGFGHGDALHVSDLNPSRPGLEVFRIQERFDDAGMHMFAANNGDVLWKIPSVSAGRDGEGPGRGLAMDIDARYEGAECWAVGAGMKYLYDCQGNVISDARPSSCNFGVWWDGDLQRELLDRTAISKWNGADRSESRLLTAKGCSWNNGTKANPCLSADILGDWREEVIWRSEDNKELRIYTTTIPTEYRFCTLMHDPQYRLSIAWENVGYNQPPHTGFVLGTPVKSGPFVQDVVLENDVGTNQF